MSTGEVEHDRAEKLVIKEILQRARPAHRDYIEKLVRESSKGDDEALELLLDTQFLENAGWIEPATFCSR